MAAWRQAIELAIGEEDLAAWARLPARERSRRAGSSGRYAAGLPGRPVLF
jgi:hypothetical protein